MPRRRAEHLAAGTLLALFVLALFHRLLLTDRVLASGDILHYFYPYRDYAAAALGQGRLPLWNPYIFLGAPFLANPQAAVLYPLHWPLSGLPVTRQIYWSGALHAWILGLGGYALLRRWDHGLIPGLVTGLVLAGSGFVGGLLGHINQMNGVAWLPWTFLALAWTQDPPAEGQGLFARLRQPQAGRAVAALGGLVALMLLAGHTQTAYINLFGLGVWLVTPPGLDLRRLLSWSGFWRGRIPALAVTGSGLLLGALLAGAQLLPTLELSRLGLRSGGLSYAQVTSFSLQPLQLPWTLLPSYGLVDLSVRFRTLGYTEFVAYVGGLGLLLALLGGWAGRRERSPAWTAGLLLTGLGLFLALGRWNPVYFLLTKLVPGFDLFRTPARWMMLYTLGMALLAGLGGEILLRRLARIGDARRLLLAAGGLLLLAGDLLLAARALPHTHPTAPSAVTDLRTAPAHLLTDPARDRLSPAAAGRFLSMSAITFDPGDMADWRRIYLETKPQTLDQAAFQELIIALKSQEILAPNLALLWRIPGVDGFDGGVLPLQRYNRFLTLFIPQEELVPDGRLREQLQEIPPARLLGLMNVQYVITDKVRDHWFQGVYYDRQLGATLGPALPQVDVAVDRPLEATAVDILGFVQGPSEAMARLAQENRTALRLQVMAGGRAVAGFPVVAGGRPGAHLADPRLDSPLVQEGGPVVAFRDVEGGVQEYWARFRLPQPVTPEAIRLSWVDPGADPELAVTVRAMTLVDERTGMFVPLLPSDRGRFRLVHSGDVKIYENLETRPRAYLASAVRRAANPEEVLAALRAEQAPGGEGRTVVEAPPEALQPLASISRDEPPGQATLLTYEPEQVTVQVRAPGPRLLVLTDSFYPGWEARVDGVPAPVWPVNLLFRGVVLPPGQHRVEFRFRPVSWQRGVALSGLGLVLWLGLLAWAGPRRGSFRPSSNSGV